VTKGGKLAGDSLAAQLNAGPSQIVGREFPQRRRLGILQHDVPDRFSCQRGNAGGDLEQIQMLLGQASILTTERYLGTDQNLTTAVNDDLGLEME
jgi:integrase/recombinase XerD